MSSTGIDNPFAPPRAHVEDAIVAQATMEPATRVSRLIAVIVDGLAIGGVAAVVGIAAAIAIPVYAKTGTSSGGGLLVALGIVGLLGVIATIALVVYSFVLVYRQGQTIGKRVMGIRVVRTDGTRVAFSRFIFLRWLPLFVAGLIPMVGYLVGLVDSLLIFRETRQCLHDNIADTMVVTAASSESATLAGSLRGSAA